MIRGGTRCINTSLYIWISSVCKNAILTDAIPWYDCVENLATQARHIGGMIFLFFICGCNSLNVYSQEINFDSMINNQRPNRAEINDIVGTLNAGASGLVLAAETAIGKYPVDAVRILSNIIYENNDTDQTDNYNNFFKFNSPILNEPHGGKLIQQYYNNSTNALDELPSILIDEKVSKVSCTRVR